MLNNDNNNTTSKPKKLKKWLLVFPSARILVEIRAGGLWSGQRMGVDPRAKLGGTVKTTTTRSCSDKQIQRKFCFPGLGMNRQTLLTLFSYTKKSQLISKHDFLLDSNHSYYRDSVGLSHVCSGFVRFKKWEKAGKCSQGLFPKHCSGPDWPLHAILSNHLRNYPGKKACAQIIKKGQ